MTLDDIQHMVTDHDRGAWHEWHHPVTGEPTGLRFKIAGPYSTLAKKVSLQLFDRLADLADERGRVTAADRQTARQEALASLFLDLDADGLPCSTANVLRLIRSASWVEEQADFAAGDATPFLFGGQQ